MSTQNSLGIIWFRQDLRIEDNAALAELCSQHKIVSAIYILNPKRNMGAASKSWLHYSLLSLKNDLLKVGITLNFYIGDELEILSHIITAQNVSGLYWNRLYDPVSIERDKAIKKKLYNLTNIQSFNSHLLNEPWEVLKKDKSPYLVFTPYYKACLQTMQDHHPLNDFQSTKTESAKLAHSLELDELNLKPKIKWDSTFWEHWNPGEQGAQKAWARFIHKALSEYPENRNRPDLTGVSYLSPHLHFGEISVRQIWKDLTKINTPEATCYLREIYWREFAHYILYHFPNSISEPLKTQFNHFKWHNDPLKLKAWQKGLTGYPIIDAGMRELWQTGWMHNRVRMIVGSFLVKDLLIDWREGAKWFWNTLVDADTANNTLGWQWVSGCGIDAAPYFRIFNPVIQAEKFDPDGKYIKKYVPELKNLAAPWCFKPWEAPADILNQAGIILGETYPTPIVNHAQAKELALKLYQESKLKK